MAYKITIAIILSLFIQACINHPMHKKVVASQKDASNQLETIKQQYYSTTPNVVQLEYPPANLAPISSMADPDWYGEVRNPVISAMEFGLAARTVFEDIPVSMSFDDEIDQGKKISVYHNGTLRSWLDTLSLSSGYAYKIHQSHISWHKMMTATFDIMAVSGSRNHLVGTEGESSNTQQGKSSNSEFSNNKATLSIWEDLTSLLTSLISDEGIFFVSQANTSVTVKDLPENVRLIGSVIDEFNQRLGAQVVLDVQIVSVTLDDNRKDGVDWGLVKTNTESLLNFSYGLIQANDAAIGAPAKFSASIPEGSGSSWSGSKIFVEALEQQGDVTVVTSPRAVTLNNEVAEIRINIDTSYLASSSTVINDQIAETTLQPGVVTDGFTMYVLPKIDIKDREIYLQFSTTLAELKSIDKISSGNSVIQTPLIQNTKVNTRTRLSSGETLLISGYQQFIASSNQSDQFGIDLFGHRDSASKKHEVMVLLTPVILDN